MSEVQTVAVELKVPKESKEVLDAVTNLIENIRAKKGVAEIAASELPMLIAAIDGFDKLGEEVKSEFKPDLIGYSGKEIAKALGV